MNGLSVSWLRGYGVPVHPCGLKPDSSAALNLDAFSHYSSLKPSLVAPADMDFWDVQVVRRRHVIRLRLSGLTLAAAPGMDRLPVTADLLFHILGFAVCRLSLATDDPAVASAIIDGGLQRFSDSVFKGTEFEWGLGGLSVLAPEDRERDVREVMDILMFDLYQRTLELAPADVVAGLETFETRYQLMEQLLDKREIGTAYPQTFGTHFELVWDRADELTRSHQFIRNIASGSDTDEDRFVLENSGERYWLVGENVSVLGLSGSAAISPDLATFDTQRIQLLEFATLQRTCLRAVQRQTQLAISEGLELRRRDIDHWHRLLTASTDKYLLHDQAAILLEEWRCHFHDEDDLRSPAELEEQVAENLDAFRTALDLATARAGVILGLLFGIVAALTLSGTVYRVLTFGNDLSDAHASHHFPLALGSDLAVILAFAVAAPFVYRRVSRVRLSGSTRQARRTS